MFEQQYRATITSKTPALIIFMLDLSSSMGDDLTFDGVKQTKAEFLSRIINTTLSEIVCYCKKGDKHRDYFNIIVYGYMGDSVVNLLKSGESQNSYVTINELVNMDVEVKTYDSIRKNVNGASYISQLSLKEYIKPLSSGKTPTGKALEIAYNSAERWVESFKNEDVFAPIVINISDGEFTDITHGEFLNQAQRLKSIKTDDGNLLFFNVHIASNSNISSVVFPISIEEINTDSRHAKILFEASSTLPKRFSKDISELKECASDDQFKAFCYNSSVSDLLKILNIGSLSITK